MMDYELFKEVVKEKLLSHMPDELAGYSLRADRTGKVNETLDALHLMPPSCPQDRLYPTVYLNHMYEEYKKTEICREHLNLQHSIWRAPAVKQKGRTAGLPCRAHRKA